MTRPLFLFAPGAGAPSTSPWMQRWAERLARLGEVVPFDYPYMREGRKAPDRHPVLLAAHAAALAEARARLPAGTPVVLAGKSMGSRLGCHLAVELDRTGGRPVAALVCFGYPLRGRTGASRADVLRALRTPILFLQGSRDPLCPLEDLASVRAEMTAKNQLFVVDGGDHSLAVTARAAKASGRSQQTWDEAAFSAIAEHLALAGVIERETSA